MPWSRFVRILLPLVAPCVLAACGPGEVVEITASRQAERRPLPASVPDTAARFGFVRREPPRAANPPTWTLPDGWEQLPASEMRQGNFRIPGRPDLDCYLTVLPGGGGGLLANVNRWRGQMGQGPIDAAGLRGLPRTEVMGRPAVRVDLLGSYRGMGGAAAPGQRMLGIALEDSGQGLFLKLVGPAEEVAAEEEAFLGLARSLTRERGHAHGGFDPDRLRWSAPEGWVPGAASSMRLVTFHPGGNREAECLIAVLPGAAGGLHANVNMWRSQMNQPNLPRERIDALPKIAVLGRPSTLVEVEGSYTDMAGGRKEGQMLLGAICMLGSHSLYVKFTGPAELVRAERESFLDFCRSLREEG